MEGHQSTGQSPQWAVVPLVVEEEAEEEAEEEEEEEEEEEDASLFLLFLKLHAVERNEIFTSCVGNNAVCAVARSSSNVTTGNLASEFGPSEK